MEKNIKEIKLDSFKKFERIAKKQICKNKIEQITKIINKPTDVLFRGQANAKWTLESTLTRDTRIKTFPEEKYHNYIADFKKNIETRTGKEWDLPEYIQKPYIEKNHRKIIDSPLGYEYMVYLRHFGFPSPLLDWTENFYIAAYFAYTDCNETEDVAIYIYKQSDNGSMQSEEFSTVINLGKYLYTHQRHDIQKAQYTVCKSAQRDEESAAFKQDFYYDSYEDYKWNNDLLDNGLIQNQCTKYILPFHEKEKVLKQLRECGINSNLIFPKNDISTIDEKLITSLKDVFLDKVKTDFK